MHIVSKRDSGLGDMLSNLTHCLWLADNINAKVYVDWRATLYHDAKNAKINFFPEFFHLDVDYPIESVDEIHSDAIVLPYGSGLLKKKNARNLVEPQIFETFGLTGKCPKFDVFVSTRSIDFLPQSLAFEYLRSIRIADEIKRECDQYLSNIRAQQSKIYGVHIRHGNGELYEVGGDNEKLLFERYLAAINEIKVKDPSAAFFLFTDSQAVVRWFEEKVGTPYKNMDVRYPKTIGEPMHFNTYANLFGYDILKWAVQDMYYMSKLDGLIYDSWSSYTRWPRANASQLLNENLYVVNPPRISMPEVKKEIIYE